MSLLLRGIKHAYERKAFNELRKAMLKAGLKTDLPMTVKEYTRTYDGKKSDAREDYYFNWSKQMRDFYNKLGKRAERKVNNSPELKDEGRNTRYTYNIKEKAHESKTMAMKNLKMHLKTLVNVTNKDYLSNTMTKEQKDKIPVKRRKGKVVEAGLRSKPNKPVTLQTFGGSRNRLLYNNYLVALTNLGYTKTIETILSMSLEDFIRIFLANESRLDPVFTYSYIQGSGSDEYFNAIFKEDKDYIGDVTIDGESW